MKKIKRQTNWTDAMYGKNCKQAGDDLMSTLKKVKTIAKYTKTVT